MAQCWLCLVCIVLAIAVCGIIGISVYIFFERKKYSHLPGPPVDNFFFGSVSTLSKYFKEEKFFNVMLFDWVKKYGHVFKMSFLQRTFVYTCDPQAIREMMITGNHPKPYLNYKMLVNLFGERFMGKGLVVETDQKVWVWRRAMMNPCFQRSYIRGLESALNSEVDLLTERLAGLADGVTNVHMLDEFNHLTLDIIGKIAFGMQIDNVVNRKEKSEFTKAITTCFKGLSASMKDPLAQYRFTKWSYIREVRKAARFLRSFSQNCFNERREAILKGDYTPDDILNYLVRMKIDNPDLDEEVILDDITTFFVAGQETTACLLSFAMIALWQNKDVMKRLREHVLDIVGDKPYISMDDADKMTYLDMVLKECLRLYPPGPNTFRETKHEVEMMGYKVPAGSIIFMSTYVSSRLEEFFPDPLKFDPERFNPNAENKIPSYTYYPFTLGPRTCIGRNLAEVEAKIILAKIMQRFDFEMDPDQDFSIEESTTLKPKGGAVCTLTLFDSSNH